MNEGFKTDDHGLTASSGNFSSTKYEVPTVTIKVVRRPGFG